MKNMSDLRINGHGSANGGKYDSVNINGSGRIDGDLDCIDLKINGQCNLKGNVNANHMKINGNSSIDGTVESKKWKLMVLQILKGVYPQKTLKFTGVSVEDCNAESLKIGGSFKIEGLLNADELELILYGSSQADEIGGSKITIKRKGKYDLFSLKSIIFAFEGGKELITQTIEGDEIYLENTKAKIVRGDSIELGPGCGIDLVEYKNSFKMNDDSAVTEHKKI